MPTRSYGVHYHKIKPAHQQAFALVEYKPVKFHIPCRPHIALLNFPQLKKMSAETNDDELDLDPFGPLVSMPDSSLILLASKICRKNIATLRVQQDV